MDLSKVGTDRVQQDRVAEQTAAQKSQALKEAAAEKNKSATSTSNSQAQVKWSPESQLLSEGLDLAKAAPDVRAERVAQLKQAIESGTYKVDAKGVADRMIQSSLEDELATKNG